MLDLREAARRLRHSPLLTTVADEGRAALGYPEGNTGLFASWLPARRAASVDASEAMRGE